MYVLYNIALIVIILTGNLSCHIHNFQHLATYIATVVIATVVIAT